jgi:hypothetical protein
MIERNQFSKKPHIEGQVRRMLDDPRSQAKLNDFFLHWLDMKNKELPSLSKKVFPDFSPALALDLRRSLLRWMENSIWEQMITWPQFLEMKNIEVNERIASFYGLSYPDDANTTGFVEMNASYLNRQGLHTHPYLLASHSYPEESSPIHRGVFTARKILGRILRPPTEAVSFRNADFDPNWTMRQKVTELTKAANCMSCHDQINSTGFVLENFDATGRNRSEIAGVPLDLKVEYLDSEGIERTLNGSQDLLSHALESTKPAKSFVDELFKHLAKQPVQSYLAIDTTKLSEMLQNEQLSLRDLYSQLGFLGASDGFSFLK